MCILSAVVEPVASFLPIGVANDLHRSAVGTQLVGDKRLSFNVNAPRHLAFEHLTLVIYDPPKIVHLTVNLHENHIEIPLPVQVGVHLNW